MSNGGVLGRRNVPGVDGLSGVWSLREIANARRAGVWPGYLSEVMTDNPLVYYRLDEATGTTATDSSGNGNHGTFINGPTLAQPPLIQDGRAVSFDGVNDRIDGPTVNLLGDVTVEVWHKPTSVSDTRWVLTHGADGETEAANIAYAIRSVGGNLRMFWENGAGVNTEVVSGVTMVVGARYHVVMERDATAKTVTFTVNGVAEAPVSYTNNPTGGGSGILQISSTFASSDPGAAGIVDEVAIYDHLLGSTRVTAHYNAGIGVE